MKKKGHKDLHAEGPNGHSSADLGASNMTHYGSAGPMMRTLSALNDDTPQEENQNVAPRKDPFQEALERIEALKSANAGPADTTLYNIILDWAARDIATAAGNDLYFSTSIFDEMIGLVNTNENYIQYDTLKFLEPYILQTGKRLILYVSRESDYRINQVRFLLEKIVADTIGPSGSGLELVAHLENDFDSSTLAIWKNFESEHHKAIDERLKKERPQKSSVPTLFGSKQETREEWQWPTDWRLILESYETRCKDKIRKRVAFVRERFHEFIRKEGFLVSSIPFPLISKLGTPIVRHGNTAPMEQISMTCQDHFLLGEVTTLFPILNSKFCPGTNSNLCALSPVIVHHSYSVGLTGNGLRARRAYLFRGFMISIPDHTRNIIQCIHFQAGQSRRDLIRSDGYMFQNDGKISVHGFRVSKAPEQKPHHMILHSGRFASDYGFVYRIMQGWQYGFDALSIALGPESIVNLPIHFQLEEEWDVNQTYRTGGLAGIFEKLWENCYHFEIEIPPTDFNNKTLLERILTPDRTRLNCSCPCQKDADYYKTIEAEYVNNDEILRAEEDKALAGLFDKNMLL